MGNPNVKSLGWKGVHRSKGKQELGLPGPQERLGVLRRWLGELRPFKNKALDALPNASPGSDTGRREVAVAKASFETWRAQAYQAYWRTQAR
ncbi:MAG: hypothetical protein OEW84_06620 [Aigarchaeota archaeon]|nr:hypothetical protein [Aigarchaeota archaeon]